VAVRAFPPLPATSAAPGTCDPALDVVRSSSMLVVVLGHVLLPIVICNADGTPSTASTRTSDDPWPFLTWGLQVMPPPFIAGGTVNWRSNEGLPGRGRSGSGGAWPG